MKKYIANGRFFNSFEEVEEYAKQKGLRVTDTQAIRGKHLITLGK